MKIRLLILATAVGAVCYAIFFPDSEAITDVQALYAATVIVLGLVPAFVSVIESMESRLIPLMTLHGLFYSFTFGLPALSAQTVWYSDSESITEGLLTAILGLVCMYIGYYGSRPALKGVRPVSFLRRLRPEALKWVGWMLFGGYAAFRLFPVLNELPSVSLLSEPLGYLGLGILTALHFDGTLARGHFALLCMAIAATFALKLLSGALAQPVLLLVFLGILHWNKTHKLPWRMIAVSLAVVFLLNPVKMTYRNELASLGNANLSATQRAELLADSAERYYLASERPFIEDASTINRLAHIAVLSYVISTTPDPVPYWQGASYRTLWTSFVPRILWPDKPQATIGQEFGHRYMLLSEEDDRTSFNLPWLPEFYANFGLAGVILGMFGVGVLFRFLVHKFTAPANRTVEYVLGITMTFELFYAESNFALMIGGLLLTYLAIALILRFMASGSARAPAGAAA